MTIDNTLSSRVMGNYQARFRMGGVEQKCSPRPYCGKGRPPGTTKSEAKAKKLGLIGKKEVFNPEWLELQFGLPIGWTSPQECRAATELLAIAEQHLEIV